MTKAIDVNNNYFDWLSSIVVGDRFAKSISYNKLLMHLHRTPFRWSIELDRNRAEQGIDMRYYFTLNTHCDRRDADYIEGPCSVLEMMIALARHCEGIMDDPEIGDRTGEWFWRMVNSLGLSAMSDNNYDRDYVEYQLQTFLDREYASNGKGGLFTIKDTDKDLRDVEIWYQMCWYINKIAGY